MNGPTNIAKGDVWTDARIADVKACLEEGLSAALIARRLGGGVTRNAVIGIIYRRGLSARRPLLRERVEQGLALPTHPKKAGAPSIVPGRAGWTPSGRVSTDDPKAKTAAKPRAAATVLPAARRFACAPAPEPRGIGLADLREPDCRWPLGDPCDENFRYCGAPREAKPRAVAIATQAAWYSYCAGHCRLAYADGRAMSVAAA